MSGVQFEKYMEAIWEGNPKAEDVLSEKTYLTSEYQAVISPFLHEFFAFEQLVQNYRENYVELFEDAQKAVVRHEYGKGSKYLIMGYYQPDRAEEVIVCNAHRGRLLRRITKSTKPDHIYVLIRIINW